MLNFGPPIEDILNNKEDKFDPKEEVSFDSEYVKNWQEILKFSGFTNDRKPLLWFQPVYEKMFEKDGKCFAENGIYCLSFEMENGSTDPNDPFRIVVYGNSFDLEKIKVNGLKVKVTGKIHNRKWRQSKFVSDNIYFIKDYQMFKYHV